MEHKADAHSHGEQHGSLFAHSKVYLFIGLLLFVFTLITVGLSYVDFAHIGVFKWAFGFIGVKGDVINIVIGMIVATFKVCLVGAWFMHLKQENMEVWRPLLFTFFFVFALFMLVILAHSDPIPGSSNWTH